MLLMAMIPSFQDFLSIVNVNPLLTIFTFLEKLAEFTNS